MDRASAQRYFSKAARYHAGGVTIPKASTPPPSVFIEKIAVSAAVNVRTAARKMRFSFPGKDCSGVQTTAIIAEPVLVYAPLMHWSLSGEP